MTAANQPRLRPPRHPVDPRCVWWWRVRALVPGLPLAVLGSVVAVLAGPILVRVAAAAVVVLSLAYVVAMPAVRYRIHRWEVTEDAVYTKSGWLTQQWRIAPLSRIQTVDSHRSPLQQALGLSTVVVTTASAAGALDITALDAGLAEEVVAHLTAATQRTPEDGT